MNRSYRDLRVWQRSMELVFSVYTETRRFPKEGLYGLVSQMRRSAVSVPSNIAEGKGRRTDRDFSSFLFRARGSLLELETQVLLARRLEYVQEQDDGALLKSTAAVGSALTGLINSLRESAETAAD